MAAASSVSRGVTPKIRYPSEEDLRLKSLSTVSQDLLQLKRMQQEEQPNLNSLRKAVKVLEITSYGLSLCLILGLGAAIFIPLPEGLLLVVALKIAIVSIARFFPEKTVKEREIYFKQHFFYLFVLKGLLENKTSHLHIVSSSDTPADKRLVTDRAGFQKKVSSPSLSPSSLQDLERVCIKYDLAVTVGAKVFAAKRLARLPHEDITEYFKSMQKNIKDINQKLFAGDEEGYKEDMARVQDYFFEKNVQIYSGSKEFEDQSHLKIYEECWQLYHETRVLYEHLGFFTKEEIDSKARTWEEFLRRDVPTENIEYCRLQVKNVKYQIQVWREKHHTVSLELLNGHLSRIESDINSYPDHFAEERRAYEELQRSELEVDRAITQLVANPGPNAKEAYQSLQNQLQALRASARSLRAEVHVKVLDIKAKEVNPFVRKTSLLIEADMHQRLQELDQNIVHARYLQYSLMIVASITMIVVEIIFKLTPWANFGVLIGIFTLNHLQGRIQSHVQKREDDKRVLKMREYLFYRPHLVSQDHLPTSLPGFPEVIETRRLSKVPYIDNEYHAHTAKIASALVDCLK